MEITIQFIHCNADTAIQQYAEKKVEKLKTFYNDIIQVSVHLKHENAGEHENKVVEIKLDIPHQSLYAKEQCHSFECAIDLAYDTLKLAITKAKEKQRAY